MNDLLRRLFEQALDARLSHMEALVLAGCSRCGRRLIQDGRPLSGCSFVVWQGTDRAEAWCAECMKTLEGA